MIKDSEKVAKDLGRGIDYIGLSCSFVVHDGKGNILLQKRSQQCRDEQGTWDIGGGAVEFGEDLKDAVAREVKEELTTTPFNIQFLTIYDAHRSLADGTPTHWVAVIWSVQVDPLSISIGEPDKIDELNWFTSATLPAPLHSQFYKSFKAALARGIVN